MTWLVNLLSPILGPFVKPIVSTLWSMILKLVSGPVLKSMILSAMENFVKKAELSAQSTPDKKDDEDAKMMRNWLEEYKKAFEVKDGTNT